MAALALSGKLCNFLLVSFLLHDLIGLALALALLVLRVADTRRDDSHTIPDASILISLEPSKSFALGVVAYLDVAAASLPSACWICFGHLVLGVEVPQGLFL